MKGSIVLIAETVTVNELRIEEVAETRREVLAEIESISQSEYFAAQDSDLNPEYRFRVFFADYGGEKIVEFEGERFAVYRTFRNFDRIELYTERKVGADG